MGGGKTHNMIALGLLAKHPEYRSKALDKELANSHLGKIKVVVFTGRESDVPYGIWGEIAKQLGKEKVFAFLKTTTHHLKHQAKVPGLVYYRENPYSYYLMNYHLILKTQKQSRSEILTYP